MGLVPATALARAAWDLELASLFVLRGNCITVGAFDAVVCDHRGDSVLLAQFPDRHGGRRFGADDTRAAVRDDGLTDPGLPAPRQLGADRSMADEPLPTPAHQWAIDAGAVAHVQAHVQQRGGSLAGEDHVRHVADHRLPSGDAITHRRRTDRMFHRIASNPIPAISLG